MDEMFKNQDHIAAKWREQIAQLVRDREAARQAGASGGRIGSFTVRINKCEEMLLKLTSKGVLKP